MSTVYVSENRGPLLYNPHSKETVRDFAGKHAKEFTTTTDGHKYFLNHKDGNFIFAPYGDLDKARSIRPRILKDGQWKVDRAFLEKSARIFAVSYETIENKKEKLKNEGKSYKFTRYVFDRNTESIRGIISRTADTRDTHIGASIKLPSQEWERVDEILKDVRKDIKEDGHKSKTSSTSKKKKKKKLNTDESSNSDNSGSATQSNNNSSKAEVSDLENEDKLKYNKQVRTKRESSSSNEANLKKISNDFD